MRKVGMINWRLHDGWTPLISVALFYPQGSWHQKLISSLHRSLVGMDGGETFEFARFFGGCHDLLRRQRHTIHTGVWAPTGWISRRISDRSGGLLPWIVGGGRITWLVAFGAIGH